MEIGQYLQIVDGVADSDLVLLVTTRPTTGNTLAWAVACERDQWGRAIAGAFYVMHVLGFDPHAFAHFRDERKRRRSQVTVQVMDEKLGRMVTRIVLPRVVMRARYHYGVSWSNLTEKKNLSSFSDGSIQIGSVLKIEIMTSFRLHDFAFLSGVF
ncbi:hypothetical protein BHE74_00010097 [Ensete ventricosum]|nr:hypothetical protein BHE74_00010097 [Ensete ventricosum]RZR89238.1 hypothetical protein BHM03_00016914 [Ensete ventricosum]